MICSECDSEVAHKPGCTFAEDHFVQLNTSWLHKVDGLTSLIAHRHSGGLPNDVVDELLEVSREARRLIDRRETYNIEAALTALAEALEKVVILPGRSRLRDAARATIEAALTPGDTDER